MKVWPIAFYPPVLLLRSLQSFWIFMLCGVFFFPLEASRTFFLLCCLTRHKDVSLIWVFFQLSCWAFVGLSNVKTHVLYFYKFFLYSFTDDSFFLCSLFLVLLLFKHYNSWDGMGWSEISVASLHTSLNSPLFSMIPGFQLFLVPIPLLFSPETTTLSSL